jgi:sugar transferase (PEP-CTERM system associated)
MIHIFSHYVPGRLIVLAVVEALVLVIAAYFGIFLHVTEFGVAAQGVGAAVPPKALAFALCMMIAISGMGLYRPDLWNDKQSIGVRVAAAFVVGFGATALIAYLVPALEIAPDALGSALLLALGGSVLTRAAFHKWNEVSTFKARVLVIGTGSRAVKLAEYAPRSPNHRVIGFVSFQPSRHYVPEQQVLSVAPGETLSSIVARYAIDQIVVAVRDRRGGGFPVQQLLECKAKGVTISELPTFFEREYRQVMLESLNPSWMVFGDGFRRGLLGNVVKRLFDLAVSSVLLVLTLPIMLITALFIYLESGLPVLYRQERVGQGGRVFTLYKFRSMRIDAEKGGAPQWASRNDDRATRVGLFIRKWRIDELPQIFNVLRGDMSFVGPRPERAVFVDQLEKQIPYYALRHSAKPGITGWAQVRYQYGASVDDAIEKLQYDLYYVKNRCLFLDLMIMFATVEVVLWGRGAR